MKSFFNYIIPALNTDVVVLRGILEWSTRAFSAYSFLLFEFVQWNMKTGIIRNMNIFLLLFFLQAAILMYVFQSYRRLFIISKMYEKNLMLSFLSFSWLLVFFLYNVIQLVFGVLIAGQGIGLLWIAANLIPIFLLLMGEYLFRRTSQFLAL